MELRGWNFVKCLEILANEITKYDGTNMNAFGSPLVSKPSFIPYFTKPSITHEGPSKIKF